MSLSQILSIDGLRAVYVPNLSIVSCIMRLSGFVCAMGWLTSLLFRLV